MGTAEQPVAARGRSMLALVVGVLVLILPHPAAGGSAPDEGDADRHVGTVRSADAGSRSSIEHLRARSDDEDVILTWEPPPHPEGSPVAYRVEALREGEPLFEEVVEEPSFVHEDLAPARIHHYVITARFASGREAEPFTTPPAAFFPPPENLEADVDGDTVALSWDRPSELPAGTRVGYDVFRGDPGSLEEEPEPLAAFVREDGAGEFGGGVTETTFVDTGLDPGTYVYSVQAVYLDEKYEQFWRRRDEMGLRPPPSDGPSVRASVDDPAASTDDDATGEPIAIESPSAAPGGRFVVSGDRCPAAEEVVASVDGTEVGRTTAGETGGFALEATAPVRPGVVEVEVACGDVRATASLAVVFTISTGGTSNAVVGAVLAFFVLVAPLLWPRRPLREQPGRHARSAPRR